MQSSVVKRLLGGKRDEYEHPTPLVDTLSSIRQLAKTYKITLSASPFNHVQNQEHKHSKSTENQQTYSKNVGFVQNISYIPVVTAFS